MVCAYTLLLRNAPGDPLPPTPCAASCLIESAPTKSSDQRLYLFPRSNHHSNISQFFVPLDQNTRPHFGRSSLSKRRHVSLMWFVQCHPRIYIYTQSPGKAFSLSLALSPFPHCRSESLGPLVPSISLRFGSSLQEARSYCLHSFFFARI